MKTFVGVTTPSLARHLTEPLTFDEYVEMVVGDGCPPPTREDFEASKKLAAELRAEVGVWRGMTFIEDKRR